MPAPRKKLPTGPIKIASPFPETAGKDPLDLNTSDLTDSTLLESGKQDSLIQEKLKSSNIDVDKATVDQSSQDLFLNPDLIKQESGKQESFLEENEYKKVAMRLSASAVDRLRSLRVTTGIPYEVLVDVMIQNWNNLPSSIQQSYLLEAKQRRIQRLIAGQDKAMQTVKQRLTKII
jgi:predicted DNA binding CopG/RHH family protein